MPCGSEHSTSGHGGPMSWSGSVRPLYLVMCCKTRIRTPITQHLNPIEPDFESMLRVCVPPLINVTHFGRENSFATQPELERTLGPPSETPAQPGLMVYLCLCSWLPRGRIFVAPTVICRYELDRNRRFDRCLGRTIYGSGPARIRAATVLHQHHTPILD